MAGLRRLSSLDLIVVVTVPMIGGMAVVGLWLYAEGGHPGGGLGGASLAYSLGRLVGLLAGYLMMLQLLLASKLPVLKRRFGVGNMIRWHQVNGTVLLSLVALHVVLLVASTRHLAPVSSLWEAFTWLVSTRAGVPLAVAAGWLFVITGTTTVLMLRRLLRYQAWHAVHLLGYAAIGLAVPHQLQSGSTLASVTGARVAWVAAYVGAAGVLVGSRWLPPLLATTRAVRPAIAAQRSRAPIRAPLRSRRDVLHVLAGVGVGAGLMAMLGRDWSARATDDASARSPTRTPTSESPSAPGSRELAAVTDVQDGGALDVSAAAGEPAYLVRTGDDVRLISAVCTHAECLAAWEPAARQFQCPCHLGTYDQQGQVVSGPPPRPLAELPTVVASGTVYLTG